MENYLKEINAVLGVVGSFVCLPDASVAASLVPNQFDSLAVETAARAATQTFNALDGSGQRVLEADLVYGQGRLVMKNLRGGILVIICTRALNTPLLNLTANVVAKKIAAELKPKTAPSVKPAAVRVVPLAPAVATSPASPAFPPSQAAAAVTSLHAPPKSAPAPCAGVLPNSLYVELEKETQRLLAAANVSRIVLCVMDPLALWAACTETRQWVSQPQKRHIDFCGTLDQSPMLRRLFDQMGYKLNQRLYSVHGNERLHFDNLPRDLSTDIYLDTFAMYHRFDLRPLLAAGAVFLPETQLALIRLQLVEIAEADLSDLCALFVEHKLTLAQEKDSIDGTQISRLCADDWGWYRTVKTNLDRLVEFADMHLEPSAREILVTRAGQIQSSIEVAPKSLRWLARAGIGEGVRWYETPQSGSASARPDMALG